jgi:hypothetical protein
MQNIFMGMPGSGKSKYINEDLIPALLKDSNIKILVLTNLFWDTGSEDFKLTVKQPSQFNGQDINWITIHLNSEQDITFTLSDSALNVIVLRMEPGYQKQISSNALQCLNELNLSNLPIDALVSDDFLSFYKLFPAQLLSKIPSKTLVFYSFKELIDRGVSNEVVLLLKSYSHVTCFNNPHQPFKVKMTDVLSVDGIFADGVLEAFRPNPPNLLDRSLSNLKIKWNKLASLTQGQF